MVEEGPQVFTPLPEEDKNKKYQEEVPVYVQKWMTFKELMIILQANLQEIVDQWVSSLSVSSSPAKQGAGKRSDTSRAPHLEEPFQMKENHF